MSQVKKFKNPSGSIDKDSYNKYYEEIFEEFRPLMKKKNEIDIGGAVAAIRDMPEGTSLTVDPVGNTYSVTGQNAEQYKGSQEDLKQNWITGKIKFGDRKDSDYSEKINSLAALMHSKVMQKMSEESANAPQPAKKLQLGIGNYQTDYLFKTPYPSEDIAYREFDKLKTDPERQEKLLSTISPYLQSYLTEGTANAETADYIHKDKVVAMQNAISNPNKTKGWEDFRTIAMQVGWDPDAMLLSPEQKTTIESDRVALENKTKEEATAADLAAKIKTFTDRGFPLTAAQAFAGSDYTFANLPTSDGPSGAFNKILQDYLTKNRAYMLEDKNEKPIIVDYKGNPFNIAGTRAELGDYSPLLGHSWNYDQNLGYSDYKYNKPDVMNFAGTFSNITPAKEVLSEEEFNQTIAAFENAMSTIGVGESTDKMAESILATLIANPDLDNQEVTKLLEKYNSDLRTKNLTTTGAGLKQSEGALDYTTKAISKAVIGENLGEKLFGFKYKQGGILKLASGDKFAEYRKKLLAENPDFDKAAAATTKPEPPLKDIRGTWKDMGGTEKALRAASIAGVGASFIPGVGAAGAIATTLADIGADVAKDGFQGSDIMNTNTYLNLGFVALSAIGLGGLRTLGKSLKIIKEAGAVGKEIKAGLSIAEQAARATNSTKISGKLTLAENNALKGLVNMATKAKKGEIKTVEEFLKRTKSFTEAEKVVVDKGIAALGKVAEIADPVLGSTRIGKLLQTSTKAAKAGASATGSGLRTAGKWGFKGAMMAPLVKLPGTAYTGFTEGWEYTKPTDIKDIVMGGFAAKNLIGSIRQPMIARKNAEEAEKAFKYFGEQSVLKPKIRQLAAKNPIHPEHFNEWQNSIKKASKEAQIDLRRIKDRGNAVDLKNISHSAPFNPHSTNKGGIDAVLAGQSTVRLKPSMEKSFFQKELEEAGKLAKDVKQRAKPSFKGEYKIPKSKSLTLYSKVSPQTVKRELANKALKLKKAEQVEQATKANTKQSTEQSTALVHVPSAKQKFNDYLKTHSSTIEPKITILPSKKPVIRKKVTPKMIKLQPITNAEKEVVYQMPSKEARVSKEKVAYLNKIKKSPSKKSDFKKVLGTKRVVKGQSGMILKYQSPGFGLQNYYEPSLLSIPAKKLEFNNIDLFNPISKFQKVDIPAITTYVPPIKLQKLNYDKVLGKSFEILNPAKTFDSNIPSTYSEQQATTETKTSGGRTPSNKGVGGVWPMLKKGFGNMDKTDWSNIALFANTFNTNRKIGDSQRKAASIFPTFGTMPDSYLKIGAPNGFVAAKQAANLYSQVGRMAKSTSDIDKGFGAVLKGTEMAGNAISQGQLADRNRIDALTGQNEKTKLGIMQYNLGVRGKNQSMAAEGMKNIHLINANQFNANNTAFNNLLLAQNQNNKAKDYKTNVKKYFDVVNDPKTKADIELATKEYTDLYSGEGKAQKTYEDAYKLQYKNTDLTGMNWGASTDRTAWQTAVETAANKLKGIYKPIELAQATLQMGQMLGYKKGGSLSASEKRQLAKEKDDRTDNRKEAELTFKAILHNNEMLQKALIKVFK